MKFLAPLPLTIVFLSSRKKETLKRWLMWAPAEDFKLILAKKMSFFCLSLGLREKIWKGELQIDWRGYIRYFQGRQVQWENPGVKTSRFTNSVIKVHFFITLLQLWVALLLIISNNDTLIMHVTPWSHRPLIPQLQWLLWIFSSIMEYILFTRHCP